jgi:hypothetical protein
MRSFRTRLAGALMFELNAAMVVPAPWLAMANKRTFDLHGVRRIAGFSSDPITRSPHPG